MPGQRTGDGWGSWKGRGRIGKERKRKGREDMRQKERRGNKVGGEEREGMENERSGDKQIGKEKIFKLSKLLLQFTV